MPELPEVETVRRGLEPALAGATIACVRHARPDLRFPFPPNFAERLAGRRILAVRRRAKFLLFDLDGDDVLVAHLGMSGSFRLWTNEEESQEMRLHRPIGRRQRHDHVAIELTSGAQVIYNDPRRFGFMDLVPRETLASHPYFVNLGLEPLDPGFDAAALCARLAGRAAPIKAALIDQTVAAGVGNIYACEALFLAGISPRRRAGSLARKDGSPTAAGARLAKSLRKVLSDAIEAGGSSLRDHRRTDGSLGYFQHRFSVYDREGRPCPSPDCGAPIRRIVQSGRSTFFCSACQR